MKWPGNLASRLRIVRWHLAVLGVLALLSLLGLTVYPHPATAVSGASLEAPSAQHLLGTDQLGIDIYAQLSRGFWHSLLVGFATAGLALSIGGGLGVTAGLQGGVPDALISFLTHSFLCLPQLPAMIVAGAFFGQSLPLMILILAAFSWAPIARIAREQSRAARDRDYVRLARRYGASTFYLLRRHLSRELVPVLAVAGLGVVGRAITQEAAIAFLGLGDPTTKSLGLMLNRASRFTGLYFTPYWTWWLLPPVLVLILLVLTLRLLARSLERGWIT